jgi:hypothetical protein
VDQAPASGICSFAARSRMDGGYRVAACGRWAVSVGGRTTGLLVQLDVQRDLRDL